MKKGVFYIVILVVSLLGAGTILFLPKLLQAQPICVPYVPSIQYVPRTGNFPSNQQCINDNAVIFFPTWIMDMPVVSLAGWELGFNGDDHHFGLGEVRITSVTPSGNSVTVQTRVCFRDQNSDDSRRWSYTLVVAGWLNQ